MDKRSARLELSVIKLFPKLLSSVFFDPLTFLVDKSSDFKNLIFLLKHSILTKMFLNDFTALDHPYLLRRFELRYQLLSYLMNVRFSLQRRVYSRAYSVDNLFASANWLEREVWDMFGVVFIKNTKEIRRILTDYGFQGFPLRKDFPVTGFFQVRYSEKKKRLIYFPLRVAEVSSKIARNVDNTNFE